MGTADVVDMVDVADAVCAVDSGGHGRTRWTCGRVDLWMRRTWLTVDAINDLGIWKGWMGCVVVI